MSNNAQLLLALALIGGLVALVILAVGTTSDSASIDYGAPHIASASANTQESYPNWTGARVSGNYYFGCTSKEYFERLMTYAIQGDDVAFSQALAVALTTGTCCKFENGEPIYDMGGPLFSGLTKVRRPGEYVEYWTVIEAVGD